ncbi:hypothetical protein HYU06_04860 [Candidatus Woesearchaeota archaeon]|nr:hypothetical protein [Candidatus Woesearchaeota archaeon]
MTKVIVNIKEEAAIANKRNSKIFDKHDFLPTNFSKKLAEIRRFSVEQRLRRLGITERNLTLNKKK